MTQDEEGGGLPAFLTDPKGMLRRRWPWIAMVAAVGVVATAIYVSLLPVTYLASARLVFNDQKISDKFVANATVEDPLDQLDAIMSTVLSREKLGPLVEKYHLYPKLREELSLSELIDLARTNIVVIPFVSVVPGRVERNPVFSVGFRDESPATAAAMANDVATLVIAGAGKATTEVIHTTAEFMQNELDRSEKLLRNQERLISAFKEEHRGELPSELTTNTSKLERLALERQTLGSQLEAAETRLADLEKMGDLANPSSPYARLAALRAKLVAELAANTEEHPNVITLRRQIEALEKEVATGPRSSGDPSEDIALRTAREQVAELRTQIGRIAAESADLEQRVARTPQVEEQLSALEQRQTVLQDTYISNLRKLEAANLSLSVDKEQQGTRVQVSDRAAPPSEPEKTRVKFLLAGLAVSAMAAVGVAILLEIVDPVIVSSTQIEEEIGLRVLGTVGRIG